MSTPTLTQNLVDGCQLIGIKELAARLHRAEATVRTQASREPGKLPPRWFPRIGRSTQVVWMLSVVCNWMIQQQSTTLAISEPSTPPKPNTKRRGAPNAHEKIAARNAGKTIAEYRAAQMAGSQS